MPDVPQVERAVENRIEDSSVHETFRSWRSALRMRNFESANEEQVNFMNSLAGWLRGEGSELGLYELLEDVVAEEILKDLRAKDPSRNSIYDFAPLLMYFAELPECARLVFEKRTNKEEIPANELDSAFESDIENMVDEWEAVINGRIIPREQVRHSPPKKKEPKTFEPTLIITNVSTGEELDPEVVVSLVEIHEAVQAVMRADELTEDKITDKLAFQNACAQRLKSNYAQQISAFLASRGEKYIPENWVLGEDGLKNAIHLLVSFYLDEGGA